MSTTTLISSGNVAEKATLIEQAIDDLFPLRRIDRILFVNPPDADSALFRYATAKRGRYTNYPPYGLALLAQRVRKIGIDARIVNLNHFVLKACHHSRSQDEFDFDDTWTSYLNVTIKDFRPDLIALTCMFTMTHASLKKVCEYARQFDIPIAIGGVHVTNDVNRVLDDIPAADLAFVNEGDTSIANFVNVVNRELPVNNLCQVIVNAKEHRLHLCNECRPSSEEISSIPAYDLLELSEYSQFGKIGSFYFLKQPETKLATVISNRGCRAQCTFCSVRNFNGVGVRQRTVASVVDEIELLHDKYGIGHIMWLDDDLLKDHARAIELFSELIKRQMDLTWDATNGVIAASCTDEVISAAVESGCIALNIGMESGNPEILKAVRKPGTVAKFLAAAEIFRKYEKLHASVFLMIGFPNETMRMILDTINVARTMDLDWYRISQLQPLPNTPIYDSMVAQGLIQDVGSKELRFMGGAYGKQTEMEQGFRLATANFQEAFSSIPLDSVPTKDQLVDIWFFMNYHLNFHRLFLETRPGKIDQQLKNLQMLGDVISPENGFALYFQGVLQHRLGDSIENGLINRLQQRLESSPYWTDRFRAFGLSADDLINADFKNKEIPRLEPGRINFGADAEEDHACG